MLKIIFYCVLFFLFITTPTQIAFASNISDSIQKDCPVQVKKYKEIFDEYVIRIRENIDYGCGVISAYGIFFDSDIDRIEYWEDYPESFEVVNKIFIFADKYQLDIARTPAIFDALLVLFGSGSDDMTNRFDSLFADTSGNERKQFSSEPERILYLIWAMQISRKQTSSDVFHTFHRLMSDIPFKFLPIALILEGQIAQVYPDYSKVKRLKLVKQVLHTYSVDFMARVVGNKMALPNIVFLLPPQLGDIPGIQGLTDNELKQFQRNYMRAMKVVVVSFEELSNDIDIGIAMDSMSVLSFYILDALQKASGLSIETYLKAQIRSPVFKGYIAQQGHCNKDDFSKIVANFFSYLAPQKVNKRTGEIQPILPLKHNLADISLWYEYDMTMREWVSDYNVSPDSFILNMSWLPYSYMNSNIKERQYVSKLLQMLPGTLDENASFISALYDQTEYISWVGGAEDADIMIDANEDVGDNSAPKYLYILTTPYPAQNDSSIFERFNNKISGVSDVSDVGVLLAKTVDDIELHEFTQSEKWSSALNTADNILTVASIVAIPLTGGASITIIAAKIAAKQAAKKGIKAGMKEGYRYTSKTVSRNVGKSVSNLTGKKGKKGLLREAKELAGMAEKRGRKSLYHKNQVSLRNGIEKSDNVSSFTFLSVYASDVASTIFCARYDSNALSSNTMLRNICGLQESHISTNICNKERLLW